MESAASTASGSASSQSFQGTSGISEFSCERSWLGSGNNSLSGCIEECGVLALWGMAMTGSGARLGS
jgi:hypothetical protein